MLGADVSERGHRDASPRNERRSISAVAASIASGQATTGGGIATTFGYPQHSTYTYPLWLYVVGFRYNALGYANALAVLLFVVAFAVTLLMLRRTFRGEPTR